MTTDRATPRPPYLRGVVNGVPSVFVRTHLIQLMKSQWREPVHSWRMQSEERFKYSNDDMERSARLSRRPRRFPLLLFLSPFQGEAITTRMTREWDCLPKKRHVKMQRTGGRTGRGSPDGERCVGVGGAADRG